MKSYKMSLYQEMHEKTDLIHFQTGVIFIYPGEIEVETCIGSVSLHLYSISELWDPSKIQSKE